MEENNGDGLTGKSMLWSLVAGLIVSGAVYLQSEIKVEKDRRANGICIYSATQYKKVGGVKTDTIAGYAYERIHLNDTMLFLYDADTNKVVDGVYYGNNWSACDGKLGVDSVFYKKMQELNNVGPEYGRVNFKINKSTVDLATIIYNTRAGIDDNRMKWRKAEWREDVRNLVQMVNEDYKSMWAK